MNSIHHDMTPEERERAWQSGDREGAGYPLRRSSGAVSRTKMRRLLDDKAERERVMGYLAGGDSIAVVARRYQIDYPIFYRLLMEKCSDEVKAARAAFAEEQVMANLEMADDVQRGRTDPGAARAAAGIRQWYAERVDPEQWGQKSSVDVNHRGVVGLHMEALKAVGNEPLEGEVEDAEFTEIPDEEASYVEGGEPEGDSEEGAGPPEAPQESLPEEGQAEGSPDPFDGHPLL